MIIKIKLNGLSSISLPNYHGRRDANNRPNYHGRGDAKETSTKEKTNKRN